MPIFYECQRCAACCRWPGQVRLTDEEVARIAAFKGMTEYGFIQQFTRLRSDRGGLSLIEQPDHACVFLKDNACSIQPVKPQQCRNFPNLWRFPGFERECESIPVEVSDEEYARRIALIKEQGNEREAG